MWLQHDGEVALCVGEVLEDLVQRQLLARGGVEEGDEAVQGAGHGSEDGGCVEDVVRLGAAVGVREREVGVVPDGAEKDVGDWVHGPVAVAGEEDAADVLARGVAWQHGERPEVEAMDSTVERHLQ
jgi:hypothetical protein